MKNFGLRKTVTYLGRMAQNYTWHKTKCFIFSYGGSHSWKYPTNRKKTWVLICDVLSKWEIKGGEVMCWGDRVKEISSLECPKIMSNHPQRTQSQKIRNCDLFCIFRLEEWRLSSINWDKNWFGWRKFYRYK